MEFAEELRASLQEFLSWENIEIRREGQPYHGDIALVVGSARDGGKPLLHLWGENCNVTRRVLAIADHSTERLALAVERFGRSRPERLEMIRLNFARAAKDISREEFCEQLRRILAEQFPDEIVERMSIAADLEHSLSRMYVRGIVRRGLVSCAFLAVPQSQSQDTLESCLTYALLWFDRARQSAAGSKISSLRLIVPKGKATLLANRLAAVDAQYPVVVYELDSLSEKLEKVDPCASGNVSSWLVPRRESQLLLERAAKDLAAAGGARAQLPLPSMPRYKPAKSRCVFWG